MLRRFTAVVVAVAASGALAACGEEHEVTKGETEGIYVNVDHLRYQVQISRVLNPDDAEDRAYLQGVPADEAELGEDEEWFGVFLRVENRPENDETRRSASDLKIEDTTGAEFEPLPLDVRETPLAYAPSELEPGTQFPPLGAVAQTTTTAGAVLIFKIPQQNLENRPLELHISSPGGEPAEATVNLDV